MTLSPYIEIRERGGEMNGTSGYSLQREIVDVLLNENPEISDGEIQNAGGGAVALVLTMQKPRAVRLHRLAKELAFHSRRCSAQVVLVTMETPGGVAWEVLPLSRLRDLAEEAISFKSQRRLQAALRSHAR
ncbi:hypothetical protein LXH09_05710 [Streptomyces sp. CS7]|uniref:hypothetical protein n=1 Tax=Streptomyces sp. CS-7 TaxID=2906769 RepID=UPI0021B399AD|nr:hypothetical protein [Streptomyces sp. CS-7]MCT6776120.1 hypothetical protein [Streptomyces sp. CS-7]